MKKWVFLMFLLVANVYCLRAAYLENVPQKLTQPDGAVINCFVTGDEFYRVFHDSLGYTIVKNPQSRYFVYALPYQDSLIASDYIVGRSNPVALGLQPRVKISAARIQQRRAEFYRNVEPPKAQKAITASGILNNIVIFISFADDTVFSSSTYTGTKNNFNDSASGANSVYNFYKRSSYGEFAILSHFYPVQSGTAVVSYIDTNTRAYFSPYDASSNTIGYSTYSERTAREHALLKRAVNSIASSVPTSLNLDLDNNGRVDNVAFIINGSTDGWNDLLWPHRWSLYSTSANCSINGKRVYDYNFLIETDNTVGVISHELMHTLGAPDLYHYGDDGLNPVGKWDLMASTNRGRPQGLSAYMKYKYGGWLPSPTLITAPGTYTLYPANGTSKTKTAYRINLPNSNEYIVLDYRRGISGTIDEPLSASGIIISRVNPNMSGNDNYNGTTYFDEFYVFRPNGGPTANGSINNAYFSQNISRTSFGDDTNPHLFVCAGDTVHGIYISNITAAGDSIQFTYQTTVADITLSKTQMELGYQQNSNNQVAVSATGYWSVTGLDTAWLSVNQSFGNAGTSNIVITAKKTNDLHIRRNCTLTFSTDNISKTMEVYQGTRPVSFCEELSNVLSADVISTPTLTSGASHVADFYYIEDTIAVDSIAIYFGAINLVDNKDSILLEFANANSSYRPGSNILTQKVALADMKPNDWNVIPLTYPFVTARPFHLVYPTQGEKGSTFNPAIVYNSTRLPNYGTIQQKVSTWKRSDELAYEGSKATSLAVKLFACEKSPDGEYITVSTNTLTFPYSTAATQTLTVSANVDWKIYNLPDWVTVNTTEATGNQTLTFTTNRENFGNKVTHETIIRKGTNIAKIYLVWSRGTIYLSATELEMEYQRQLVDSTILVYAPSSITWVAKPNAFFAVSSDSVSGNGRLIISTKRINASQTTLTDTIFIYSDSRVLALIVRQKPAADAKIEETTLSSTILYPNPASGVLYLESLSEEVQKIEVYNVLGQKMAAKVEIGNRTVVYLDNFSAGVYWMKIQKNSGLEVKSFIVK